MCGICGISSHSAAGEIPDLLAAMNQAIFHRGPNDAGQYITATTGIAMRRLSIIDLAGGHQPIFNEDGRISIVFNGEIYNFQELKERLYQSGHHFQTQSDTEVILHLYEDEGENAPGLLKGMFAFCIYDQRDNSFFIARDRFGEKPLYYFYDAQAGFIFSSEIKSLLQCPAVPRVLDPEALGYYLRVGLVPAPLTLFKQVSILPPGHWLKWRDGRLTIQSYYEVDYSPDAALEPEEVAIEAVRTTLRQAVKRQSISDVPLGAFLSGGIDSSSVAAMLQSVSSRPIKTFTVRFEEASYDESAIARTVAQALGTEHHEIVIPNVTFAPDDLWRIVDHVGQPFYDTSAIPTYMLSKAIRQEVTVALSGDGGDEMFAGYPTFQWGQTIQRIQKLPRGLVAPSARLTGWLSHQSPFSKLSSLRRIQRGLGVAAEPAHLMPIAIHTAFEPSELNELLCCRQTLAVATGNLPFLTDLPPEAEHWTPLRQLMYYRLKHNLHDDMLTKVDRMSMGASLEVRAPMLDPDLAALSMRLPDKHLIQNGVGKAILRKAMQDQIPKIVFTHPKTGFSIPLHKFQNESYQILASELLLDRTGVMQLFDQTAVASVLAHGLHQQTDSAVRSVYRASHQLWGLMQLAAWGQRFNVSL